MSRTAHRKESARRIPLALHQALRASRDDEFATLYHAIAPVGRSNGMANRTGVHGGVEVDKRISTLDCDTHSVDLEGGDGSVDRVAGSCLGVVEVAVAVEPEIGATFCCVACVVGEKPVYSDTSPRAVMAWAATWSSTISSCRAPPRCSVRLTGWSRTCNWPRTFCRRL